MFKKMQAFLKANWPSWLGILFLAFLFLVYGSYHLAYWRKIYPGVKIVNLAVGNKTSTEAGALIENFLTGQDSPGFLSLFFDGQQWPLDLQEINFSFQPLKTAQRAYQIGRQGQAWLDFKTKVSIWFQPQNLELDYNLDQEVLRKKIADISEQIFIPAIEPTIKLNEKPQADEPKIIIEPGKDGQEVDQRQLLNLLHQQLATANFNPLEIPVLKTSPTLTETQISQTKTRAEKFLEKKLILAEEQSHWELGDKDLIGFLSFTNGFDQEKIASWAATLATNINRLPENAAFQFVEGKVTEFRPAKEGKTLDQKKTVDLIAQSLKEIEEGQSEKTIILPVSITEPVIKTADVNNLGIKEMVGQGISFFQGSIPNRIHNLQLASSRLNGLLIPPGETFSFNQQLGEVSQATGYKEAYIIKEGRTILGDGGGVCQTSTTFFRAALQAGLPIVERRAHAYRVAYYEQNSPVGLDATVFDPSPNLKVKNDTPAHLLLQTEVDLKKQKLTYTLYGTGDGRRVTLSKPKMWDQIPPPPDLYQDDPTLPTGTVKQIDWKAWGAKVAFDYKVERNGEILQNRTFYSQYQPWQAIFLRGTGSTPQNP